MNICAQHIWSRLSIFCFKYVSNLTRSHVSYRYCSTTTITQCSLLDLSIDSPPNTNNLNVTIPCDKGRTVQTWTPILDMRALLLQHSRILSSITAARFRQRRLDLLDTFLIFHIAVGFRCLSNRLFPVFWRWGEPMLQGRTSLRSRFHACIFARV
jgi:hypothetical protein